jgi:flagellar motor switch protein FliN/FliY
MLTGTLLAAAEAAAAALPAEVGWSCQATEGGTAPVPGAKAGAVAAPVGAGDQRLVLAVSAVLGRSVQVGPPPADDLREGLQPAFNAAAAALGLAGAAPVETPAEAALRPGPGEQIVSVALIDGDTHVGTLALIGPAAPASSAAELSPADEPAGHSFEAFSDGGAQARAARAAGPIELLSDVEMGVTVELGRTRMLVRDILDLSPGSVIELDRAAGSPIDVMVNGTLIARGEVVVIDEEFGVRITEVIGYDDSARR